MFIVGLRLGRVEGVNVRPVNNGPFSIDGREDGMAGDQITVAELLARRAASRKSADVAGEPADDADVAPRRHRNIEQGGVSVAELTGSIPKVTDEHLENGGDEEPTDVDVDDVDEVEAESSASVNSESADSGSVDSDSSWSDETWARAAQNDAHDDQSADDVEPVDQSADDTRVIDDEADVDSDADAADVEAEDAAGTVWNEDTWAVSADDADDSAASSDIADDDQSRGSVSAATSRTSTPSTEETRNLQQITDEDLAAADEHPDNQGLVRDGYPSDDSAGIDDEPAYRHDEQAGILPEEEYDDSDHLSEYSDEDDEFSDRDEAAARATSSGKSASSDKGESSDKMNIGLMIVQIIVALAAGVAVFKGFTILWNRFSVPLTALLAIVMTLVFVGVVHALLREKDKLIMLLAAVVGLALTFGPYLVVM
ncbi:hypothetical protein L3H50_07445 [Corynebacterium sp. MC-04]|uniref:Transmembrane protein n=1 Tax=Corynebacterium parakroppenstedtii TaxID=2828363 RepID=A0ABS9HM17_9CORY|nr:MULTISPECIES: hypothetical protein [Corynebacterium]KXB49509.1 hypothetical protein HMPREF1861_02276 [Corynebacterium kroppenstedtii]MBY0788564.1 hypothetical protein [Corynebacterium parakroppenstedtii]MBY0792623.1 hypothetical protein [Corynebacterium parakroppenstedtii]MBY0796724.1 hypothetical protein [Corynebacterium parakroppenstedtii]MCF6769980.1 hypothetical protein [Corynebacterium parakroppenstedtii]